MKKGGTIPAIAAALLSLNIFSSPAHAFSSEITQRLCTEADLAGLYRLVELRETPKGEEDGTYATFHSQYLNFKQDHKYDFLASKHGLKTPEEFQLGIRKVEADFDRIPDHRYTLDNTGILNFYVDDRLDYSYRCMIVIKAVPGDQVGDLMLNGYSKHKTELYKLYRRWQ